ncbi:MAG TPA: YggS family pyridoxal phosphate-dependent enzyme [Geopsychrobacteraceae bacterium]|nr:YggS family pyridoxal phosphate-dependent enzyme [Geopsychrobacteraceae bacterium]
MNIAANIAGIRDRIDAACERVNRNPAEVRLIAVSKVKPAELIDAAFACGQHLFGESYVQEFRDKSPLVKAPVEWHYIGGLQSNKVKYLRGKVAMIHSVDRLSLAKEISRQWDREETPVDILLQVNLGKEESKSGCDEDRLEAFAKQVSQLPNLHICGLMTLPPNLENPEDVRPFFRRLRELSEQIGSMQLANVEMRELSMGMSGDFEVAIEEGATLVRVGTAIFGERIRKG